MFINTVKPRLTDTRLIRTPHYYGQFALSLGKEMPYILQKFEPLITDTSLIRPMSVLTGFNCIAVRGTQREYSSKPLKHSIVERILVFER